MTKLRYLLLLGMTLLLNGCQMTLLDPKGLIAAQEKNLLIDVLLLMLIVVIPVIIMSFVFAWRYRAKNKHTAKYSPNWSHSNTIEAICWAVPCIIIGILATMTWITSHTLDPYRPLASKKQPLIIQAVALDWRWLFIYPKQNIATMNVVEFPVDQPIRFLITADAPMNSLAIPRLAGQIYAMAGMRTKLNLIANEKGSYYGMSTNFSGDGFSNMHFQAKVTSKEQFKKWVQTVQRSPKTLTMTAYKKLALPSQDTSVIYFSSPAKNLFNSIIGKYMGPQKKLVEDNGLRSSNHHQKVN